MLSWNISWNDRKSTISLCVTLCYPFLWPCLRYVMCKYELHCIPPLPFSIILPFPSPPFLPPPSNTKITRSRLFYFLWIQLGFLIDHAFGFFSVSEAPLWLWSSECLTIRWVMCFSPLKEFCHLSTIKIVFTSLKFMSL